MNRLAAVTGIFALLLFVFILPPVQGAESLRDSLPQRLDALAKTSPGSSQERALQKEIIALVRKMKAPPPLPPGVHRHMARGEAFVEAAKTPGGFALAVREFREAARKAPWLPQAYYNLGVIQEKAGSYDAAMESLRMYLFAAPKSPDAPRVQTLIYKIEARKEAAAQQAAERRRQEQARAESEQRRRREREREQRRREQERRIAKLRRLEGEWCVRGQKNRCWAKLKLRGDRFELHYGVRQSVGGEVHRDHYYYEGRIEPGDRMSGTYKHNFYIQGKCGGRPLTESYPFTGWVQNGGRKLAFEFTEDDVSWYFPRSGTACKKNIKRRRARRSKAWFERR